MDRKVLPDELDDVGMVVLLQDPPLLQELLLLLLREGDFAGFHSHVRSRMALLQKKNQKRVKSSLTVFKRNMPIFVHTLSH